MTTKTRMGKSPSSNGTKTFALKTDTGDHRVAVTSVYDNDGNGSHDDMVLCLTHGRIFRHERHYGDSINALNQTAELTEHFGPVVTVNEWTMDGDQVVQRTDVDFTDWRK